MRMMKTLMLLWWVALFALMGAIAACGPQPEFVTKHGLRVFDETGNADQAQIEVATDALLAELGRGRRRLENLKVSFRSDPVVINSDMEPCERGEEGSGRCRYEAAGAYYSHLVLVVVQLSTPCINRSAFIHELVHHLQWEFDKENDYLHTDPFYWEPPGGVVPRAEERIRGEFCTGEEE